MNNTAIYAPPKLSRIDVTPEWARLLSRLQQLKAEGSLVVVDLEAMTLAVVGRNEHLAPKPKVGVQSP